MERARNVSIIAVILCAVALTVVSAWHNQHYLLLSLIFVAVTMIPFFVHFERRHVNAREIVMIAMLVAIAAVSRVPFSFIPSVQPTTFVIIVSGLVFGAETGFLVGAMAALVSNMFLGQGPWTPWQMFAWGMAGFTAGLLKNNRWIHTRWGMSAFGFVWGFVFGWIMNITAIIGVTQTLTWSAFLAIYAASVYFDLLHALSNVFFLGVFGISWVKIMQRFKKKYGMLN